MIGEPQLLYAFRRNLVVAASAGTGKTHALVGVLVHLVMGACDDEAGLREPVDPSRIVATTFSRKAAAEIRARLLTELERLATGDPRAAYRADLDAARARFGLVPFDEEDVRGRARAAMDRVGLAAVGTLHSYATSLVRAHALEMGLASTFDFADEAEGRERTHDAIATVLERHADDASGTVRALAQAAGGVEGLIERLASLLGRIAEDGRGAASLVDPSADDVRIVEERVQTFVDHARALEGDRLLGGAAKNVVRALSSARHDALITAFAELAAVPARGQKTREAEAFFAFRAELPGAPIAERGRNLARLWCARAKMTVHAHGVQRLLVECEEEMATAALRDSVLSFGDVLLKARDLLRDHPHVAAEVGSGKDALLVDEFQDTSRLQCELVRLLWDRNPKGRAPGVVPPLSSLRPRGLLIVGDRKQSIYGFRGADVGVFAEMCVGLAGEPARRALGMPAGLVWEPERPLADFVALRHNRRGQDELLHFANVYSSLRLRPQEEPPEPFEIDYVPETEDLLPPPERAATASPQPRTQWLRVARGDDALTSSAMDEASVIAEYTFRIVEEGVLTVRGAPPRWRDIAVLALRHEMLDATAYALARAGIPYVIAGKGFYAAREVRDVMSLLALILDPTDKLAMLEVLRGPWAGVSDRTLVGLTDPHAGLAPLGPSWDRGERRALIAQEDRASLARMRRVVERLHGSIDRIGPATALREATRALAFDEVLALLPRGRQRFANVEKLFSMADKEPDPRRFLATLRRAASGETAEAEAATFSEEDDAVRLLTVHASKGLDFPIVFLPEAGQGARPTDRGPIAVELGVGEGAGSISVRIADDDGFLIEPPSHVRAQKRGQRREAAERARLAYVAATRASEAMIFVGDRRAPTGGPSDAFLRTAAGLLYAIESDADLFARAELTIFDVVAREETESVPEDEPPTSTVDPALSPPAWQSVSIPLEALADFRRCARRFELAHLTRLPEAAPGAQAVHGVGEGTYAAKIAQERAEVRSDEAFVARVRDDASPREVVVSGVFDRVVRWPDGSIDVLRVRGSGTYPDAFAFDVALYALAASSHFEGQARVRVGVCVGKSNPVWSSLDEVAGIAANVLGHAVRLVAHEWEGTRSPAIPIASCRAMGCGYVSLCHRPAPSVPQLSLF